MVLSGTANFQDNWKDNFLDICYSLSKDTGMSFKEALDMPISFEHIFYQSKAWESRKLDIQAERDEKNTIFKVCNEIIKGLNNLIKRS